jgi:hypothetical protein
MLNQKSPIPLILLILLYTLPCYGQWVPEGIPVVNYQYPHIPYHTVCPDGNGGLILCWNQHWLGLTDIHVQRVDSAGYLCWGTEGKYIHQDSVPGYGMMVMIPDGNNGAFIAWEDSRKYSTMYRDIYVQHIDSTGNSIWPLDGVCAFIKATDQESPNICSDGLGGVVVVTIDCHDGRHLIAQRVDSLGNRIWGDSGLYVYNNTSPWLQNPWIYTASDSSYICVWSGVSDPYNYDIFTRKISPSGTMLWPVMNLVQDVGDQHKFDAVPDNNGGIVVDWIDGARRDAVYANRIDSAGNAQWGQNGIEIARSSSGQEGYDRDTVRIFEQDNRFLMLWWPDVGDSLNAQLVGLGGSQLWGLYGRLLFLQPRVCRPMRIIMDNYLDIKFITIYDSGLGQYIGVKTDTLSSNFWLNRPFLAITMSVPYLLSDYNGGMLIVWTRPGADNIIAQRIYTNGRVGGDTTAIDDEPQLPFNFDLKTYPNPFNGNTTLRFDLPNNDDITLSLYNLIGQKLTKLALGNFPAGINRITLDLSKYPSGVYFMKLTTSEGTGEKVKLTLIK